MTDGEKRLECYLETLVTFGRTVERRQDLSAILQRACILVARAMNVPHVKIMRYRPEKADLFIEAGFGWRPGVVGVESVGIDMASPAGRSLQTAQPVTIENIEQDPNFRCSAVLRAHGIISAVNVPVICDGDVWGTLEADEDKPREFDKNETQFLMAMSHLLTSALRRSRRDAILRGAAEDKGRAQAERELLLREIDHRVKNNFQVISSIRAIEQRKIRDEEARRVLQDVLDRITAITLAHDQLSLHQPEDAADLAGYLEALCANLNRELRGRVSIVTNLGSVKVNLGQAVPLGLIVNEAVVNAANYAYAETGGAVEVTPEFREAALVICDLGSGIKDKDKVGSGTRLMNALARQIGGALERISSDEGTTIKVTFPLGD